MPERELAEPLLSRDERERAWLLPELPEPPELFRLDDPLRD